MVKLELEEIDPARGGTFNARFVSAATPATAEVVVVAA